MSTIQGAPLSQSRDPLVIEYYQTKSETLREQIILSYHPLVEYLARKLCFNRDDLDDIVQIGVLGLMRALDHFNPNMDTDFSTFATPNIVGEIRHYFRDKHHTIKIPRKLQEIHSKVRNYLKQHQDKDPQPTIAEISAAIECSEEHILEAMEANRSSTLVSLDTPSFTDGSDSRSNMYATESIIDTLGDEYEEETTLTHMTLKDLVDHLPDREREIVRLRFYQGLAQRDIAKTLNLSQMHVSRILNQILKKLGKQLDRS
jgi:RNA polymerase sigma-B factor